VVLHLVSWCLLHHYFVTELNLVTLADLEVTSLVPLVDQRTALHLLAWPDQHLVLNLQALAH
jgi:hypothetical protein